MSYLCWCSGFFLKLKIIDNLMSSFISNYLSQWKLKLYLKKKQTKQTKVFDYVIIVDKPYFGELGDLLDFLSLPSS